MWIATGPVVTVVVVGAKHGGHVKVNSVSDRVAVAWPPLKAAVNGSVCTSGSTSA